MNLSKYLFTIFVLVSAFSSALFAAEAGGAYETEVLDNGLTAVCRYMPESSLVTVRIRVLSGLSNEGKYASSGISHFLEHLIFKGTHDKSPTELHKEIKSMGGMMNGATGLDTAEYYITVPNKNFTKTVGLLADMVMETNFSREDVEKERDVILKEIKMHNDDPVTKRMQVLFDEAYKEHVYKYPIIGNEKDFENIRYEDLIRYHDEVYTPDRMVVGVVGGVPPSTAFKTIENIFGKYNDKSSWRVDVSPEPIQKMENITGFSYDVILGYMSIGFHSTSLYSPDLYPMDVLSILLGEGNASRLYSDLVKKKQLVYAISSMNYTPRYPGLFIISATGAPDKLNEARGEVFNIIDALIENGVKEAELERAKRIVLSDYLHSHERITSIGASMTNSQILTGRPDFFEQYVKKIEEVKAADVIRVASKYLKKDNSTTVFLTPRDYGNVPGDENFTPGEDAFNQPEAIPGTLKNKSDQNVDTQERQQLQKMVVLENGLKIVAKKKGELPLVTVRFVASGGLLAESKKDNGISNLTASLLLKGTATRGEAEIIPGIEKLGGRIGAFSGRNTIGFSMDLLSQDLEEGMDIFEDVAKNCIFPEEEIAKQKEKIIASINEQEKDIFDKGILGLYKMLYREHPYSMRIAGEIDTVKEITRDDIVAFYHSRVVPSGSVLAIVGDIDVDKVIKDLSDRFEGWEGEEDIIPEYKVAPLNGVSKQDIVMNKEQALFLAGFQGVTIYDERKYALDIIELILSGSGGILFELTREDNPIAYSAGAASSPQKEKGYVVLYVATTQENIDNAELIILESINRILDGEISDKEVESAKNKLLSLYASSIETNYSVAEAMSSDELFGLGYKNYQEYPQKIAHVSREDILECAKSVFDLNNYVIIVVHPPGVDIN